MFKKILALKLSLLFFGSAFVFSGCNPFQKNNFTIHEYGNQVSVLADMEDLKRGKRYTARTSLDRDQITDEFKITINIKSFFGAVDEDYEFILPETFALNERSGCQTLDPIPEVDDPTITLEGNVCLYIHGSHVWWGYGFEADKTSATYHIRARLHLVQNGEQKVRITTQGTSFGTASN